MVAKNEFQVEYEGPKRNGVPHGFGKEMRPGIYKYEGEFHFGEKHGFGQILFSNGDKYRGQWFHDAK